MKAGDLIKFSKEIALIVEANCSVQDSSGRNVKSSDFLILRNDGNLWYIVPDAWSVVNESR